VKRACEVSVQTYFIQTKFTKAGHSHDMDMKAFISWNIFMYKQCFLLKLSLAMMIKGSAIFFNHKEISVCRHFYARNEIYYLENTVFPLHGLVQR
jgi:hypothetical protein